MPKLLDPNRNIRLALDHVHGATLPDLAARAGIAAQRVYQIVHNECRRCSMTIEDARRDPEKLLDRHRNRAPTPHVFKGNAQTSREFFYEVAFERECDAARAYRRRGRSLFTDTGL